MSLPPNNNFGNLYSYKFYIRPTAHRLYGSRFSKKPKIKHHENVQKLLQILFTNGTSTTWEMAKIRFPNDISTVRTKEKEFRRLIKGRVDRGKHSSGILDLGLVVNDGKKQSKGLSDQYRLSLHGILFCIDVLNLNENDIDQMAAKYSTILPRVFGKWKFLKSIIGNDVYRIKILARGLLLDNPELSNGKTPLYELMSFLNIKYRKFYESISEHDLAEQISFWFYTCLLYSTPRKKTKMNSRKKLQTIFQKDFELKKWYMKFFKEAEKYYSDRINVLQKSGIF